MGFDTRNQLILAGARDTSMSSPSESRNVAN